MNYAFINNLLTILVAVITLVTAIQKEHAFYKNAEHHQQETDTPIMRKKKNTITTSTDMPPHMQLKIQEDVNHLTTPEQSQLLLHLVQNTNTQVETLSNSMTIIQQNVLNTNTHLSHIDNQLNQLNQRVTTLEKHHKEDNQQ